MVSGSRIRMKTKGYSDIKEITSEVNKQIRDSGISDGMVLISVTGSTASVSTIEYEPALVEDFREKLEEFASRNRESRHSQTWGDDNGFSHIRATFMGPSLTLPVEDTKAVLGTWQQIVVIDHDNRKRDREVYIQVMGE